MEIKMMETYYTDKERKFVISAFRELRIALADDLSYPEIRRIEDIIKSMSIFIMLELKTL